MFRLMGREQKRPVGEEPAVPTSCLLVPIQLANPVADNVGPATSKRCSAMLPNTAQRKNDLPKMMNKGALSTSSEATSIFLPEGNYQAESH